MSRGKTNGLLRLLRRQPAGIFAPMKKRNRSPMIRYPALIAVIGDGLTRRPSPVSNVYPNEPSCLDVHSL